MNRRIKDALIEYNKSNGCGTSDEDLIETVTEAKVVWTGRRDEHRWYTLIESVVFVAGLYLLFWEIKSKSEEASIRDMGMCYRLDEIYEAVPEEIKTVIYKAKKD